jgi:hypothetical protein
MANAVPSNSTAAVPPAVAPPFEKPWWHAPELGLLGAVLLAGLLLESRDGESVELRFASAVKLPEVCAARRCFDWRCPLCGATRSCLYLLHGQWRESVSVHRLGWLCLGVIVATAAVAAACRGLRFAPAAFSERFTYWCWSVTVGLLVANRTAELLGW